MTDRNTASTETPVIGRRALVRGAVAAVTVAAAFDPVSVLAAYANQGNSLLEPTRRLSLINTNTDERLFIDYWVRGRYVVDALRSISHLMRDHHDGTVHAIDPRLVDLMYGVYRLSGANRPVEVICGYRSPRTNARLHAHHSGVARHSMHIQGRAVDIRVPGEPLEALHRSALALRAGGVGYYPRSHFVHVDTGPLRTWGGHDDFDDAGETPEWRDALLSDTPRVEQAADTGLLPGNTPRPPSVAEAVSPRSRPARGSSELSRVASEQPVAWPMHKPMRVAHDSAPVQSESFWVRRKPRMVVGG